MMEDHKVPSTLPRYETLAGLLAGRAPSESVSGSGAWIELLELARAEGVAPLLHRALAALPVLAVPAEVRGALSEEYQDTFYTELMLEAALNRLSGAFTNRSIPVLLLKGAALARFYYEDPSTRPMADLDLLVPRLQLEAAACCMETAGFHSAAGSLATALKSPWGHLPYRHTTSGAVAELHWDLTEMRRLPARALQEVWAGARPAAPGESALVMRPGHAIPLLCAHMILRRQYASLRCLYDLHRVLLGTSAAEAGVAIDAARRWGLGPCTAHSLLRVRELFATQAPDELLRWAEAEAGRVTLQGRLSRRALTPGLAERPLGDLVDVLLNRNWSKLRVCFPAPSALRERYGLSAHQSVLPTYAVHVGRYLRKGPGELHRLWRSCRQPARLEKERRPAP